jgi:hypothetical protein
MVAAHAISLDRMVSAVEKVRARLLKACGALDQAGIRYAVVGGNAVAAWVSTIDEGAVRNTRDVDLLIDRKDLGEVRRVLEGAGFVYRHVGALDVFLDDTDGSVRDAVHLVFAGELVREGEHAPNPGLDALRDAGEFKILDLFALVQIKLTAFRDKDRTHIRDMIEVGLVDASWVERLPPPLGARLQFLLDDPEG